MSDTTRLPQGVLLTPPNDTIHSDAPNNAIFYSEGEKTLVQSDGAGGTKVLSAQNSLTSAGFYGFARFTDPGGGCYDLQGPGYCLDSTGKHTMQLASGAKLSVDLSAPGTNGIDVGVVTEPTLYAWYVIDGDAVPLATIASLQFNQLTGPSLVNAPGYTRWRRVGSIVTHPGTAAVPIGPLAAQIFGYGARRYNSIVGTLGDRQLLSGGNVVNVPTGIDLSLAPNNFYSSHVGLIFDNSKSTETCEIRVGPTFPGQISDIVPAGCCRLIKVRSSNAQLIYYSFPAVGGNLDVYLDGYAEDLGFLGF